MAVAPSCVGITPAQIISEMYPLPPKHLRKRKGKKAIRTVVVHACGTIRDKIGDKWLPDHRRSVCALMCMLLQDAGLTWGTELFHVGHKVASKPANGYV